MVHDQADVFRGPASPDTVAVAFDDERLVSDAGLLLPASLAGRLGIERLVNDTVDLARACRARPYRAARCSRWCMGCWRELTASMTWTCCERRVPAWCSGTGSWLPRHWGRSCRRSRSGMSASSTGCSTTRAATPRPVHAARKTPPSVTTAHNHHPNTYNTNAAAPNHSDTPVSPPSSANPPSHSVDSGFVLESRPRRATMLT